MEDILSKILELLLKRISVRELLDNKIWSIALAPAELKSVMRAYMSQYSDTELTHIVASLCKNEAPASTISNSDSLNFFEKIFDFSDKLLLKQENEVVCKYTRFLRWRSLVSKVSEETFVIAYMAKRDVLYGVRRKNFSHKPVISHNNLQLKTILNEGMSENHFHLIGSAPYFHLSWIHLMNNISDNLLTQRFREFERSRRNVNLKYKEEYQEEDFETRFRQAALIRLYLFSRLSGIEMELGCYKIETENLKFAFSTDGIEPFDRERLETKWDSDLTVLDLLFEILGTEEFHIFCKKNNKLYHFMKGLQDCKLPFPMEFKQAVQIDLQQLLEYFTRARKTVDLKLCHGIISDDDFHLMWEKQTLEQVRVLLGNSYKLKIMSLDLQCIMDSIKAGKTLVGNDYVEAGEAYEWFEKHGRYTGLWGERDFLYQCFSEIARKEYLFSKYESNLFHAYLVIKENIRSEMIQVNEYVGFENFEILQDRKSIFLEGDDFEKQMARMAVRDTLQSQKIESLEVRIKPELTAQNDCKKIRFYDNAIDAEGDYLEKYYYVLHFTKSSDKKSDVYSSIRPRHYLKRQDTKKRASALISFRENYSVTAKRVLGIDAAAQEIGCRPEVFAPSFRMLKNHIHYYGIAPEKTSLPQLRISYHVGEDFLDVADGLRAIEEAVLFLNLDCGDRLGHALALGINVNKWYASKRNSVSLLAQDYLDNIVWLYYAIIRYGVEDTGNLKDFLEKEFTDYFQKIYGNAIVQDNLKKIVASVAETYNTQENADSFYYMYNKERVLLPFNIHTYYKAWQLRGDMPELYEQGFYNRRFHMEAYENPQMVNMIYPEDFSSRYVPEIAYLYYLYHYSKEVKRAGAEEIRYKASAEYIEGVAAVQKKMQMEIAARGIGIESNPSSNYMIGTFKQYAEHPIINFYNRGLVTDEEKIRKCPQIWASINTDDQGVFSASLENEFALMALALERETDEDGKRLYNKTMIYEWIDNIRKNGNRQAFGVLMRKKE